KDGALTLSGRVRGRRIQALEVVVGRLNLRSFYHRMTDCFEDGHDLIHDAQNGMLSTKGTANTGKGYVEAIIRNATLVCLSFNSGVMLGVAEGFCGMTWSGGRTHLLMYERYLFLDPLF